MACQTIVGVGSINCTTYFWRVPKRRQYLCLRFLPLSFMESAIPSDWYFLAFFCLVCDCSSQICKLLILCQTFRDCGQCLNITGYFARSYIVKLISTGSHFFSQVLLLNKLHELNLFKLQNIFQTCPAA